MIKEVTDVYGRKVKIETDGQKVYSYNNKEHRVQYNAKWVDSASGFSWTDYIEDGTVEDLETRISVFGSRLVMGEKEEKQRGYISVIKGGIILQQKGVLLCIKKGYFLTFYEKTKNTLFLYIWT